MLQDGMLDKVAGRYRLTPRAINQMQRRALMEIFAHLPRGTRESHPTTNPGAGAERLEGTKKYQFGDPISELDLNASLRNARRPAKRKPTARTRPAHSASPNTTSSCTTSPATPTSPCASSSTCPAR